MSRVSLHLCLGLALGASLAGCDFDQSAFFEAPIEGVPGITHLAQTIDPLVGVDADDRIVVVGGYDGDADVGDLEVAGARVSVDGIFNMTQLLLSVR